MAINKNFVISNGLEVNEDLLYADPETKRVGINTSIPNYELDIIGSLSIDGKISAGGTTGEMGALLESTGDGIRWRPQATLRVVESYTAVEGQTIFPSTGFFPFDNADFLDVFVDGVKLAADEYNGYDGNTRIQLTAPSLGGETVEVVAYSATIVAAGYTGIQGLTVAEEGTVIGTSDGVKLINFVGAYITAIGSGAGVTVFLDDRLAQDTNFWISNVSGLSTTTNVGIKNTSPARTLDVTGTARVTSGLEAGSVFSSGVSTFSDVVIGGATTELVVTGDARITGILTIGTSSITIDGIRNEIKIGTALTLNQSGNAFVSGILTAQSFDGDGTNINNVDAVTLVGLSSDSFIRSDVNDSFSGTLSGTGSINISGVATASRVSATTGTITTLNSTTSNITRGNIVTGIVTTLSGTGFNYTGVSTATTLFSTTSNSTRANIVTGIITNLSGTNASYSGIGTVGSLNIGATQVISSGRQLQNIASLDATTTATIESAVANAPNTFTDLNVSGVGTIATLNATTGTITTLSGTNVNISGVVTAASFSGSGANVTGISTLNIVNYGIGIGGGESYWEKTTAGINTLSNVGVGTTNPTSRLTVSGDVNISGVTTATSFFGSAASLTGLTGASANTYGNETAVAQITVDANGRITGISNVLISATSGAGTNIIIDHNDAVVGTAGTINFSTGFDVTPVSAGIVTVTVVGYATEGFVGLATAGLASEEFVGLATAGLASETLVSLSTVGLASEEVVGLATAGLASETLVSLSTAGLASETLVGLSTAGLASETLVGLSTAGLASETLVSLSTAGLASETLVSLSTAGLASETLVSLSTAGLASETLVGLSTAGLASETLVSLSTAGLASETLVGLSTVGLLSETGDGSNLSNIVTSITAGTGIFVDQSTGTVTVTSTSTGYWEKTDVGINTISNVGIATTNPQTPLQVENVYGVKTGSGTFTATAGIGYTADSYAVSDFVNAEYTLFFQHSTGIQSQKVLVMDDGVTAYSQEYGIMNSNDLLVSVGATVKTGNVELWWTPETGVTGVVTYRYTRETMI